MSPKYFLLFEVKLYVKPYSPRHHGILGITSGDLTAFGGLKCHTVFKIFCQLSPLETCKFLLAVRILNRRSHSQPIPVLLPGKSHGWRSLASCSPRGHEESDMTERLHFHFSLSCIGEGNGNPLQCSCLENPRDGSLVGCHLWGRTESETTDMT